MCSPLNYAFLINERMNTKNNEQGKENTLPPKQRKSEVREGAESSDALIIPPQPPLSLFTRVFLSLLESPY